MSTTEPPAATVLRWHDGVLSPLTERASAGFEIVAADSWLVTGGTTLALDLHRSRFLDAVGAGANASADDFWQSAIDHIPRVGDWFPRVELRSHQGTREFVLHVRPAPERHSSAIVSTAASDPRLTPRIKGPDLERMQKLRVLARHRGADEAVIVTPDGYVVEGAYSSLVWWRGAILCTPPAQFDRVDSVTARALLGLATALGVELHEEAVTPNELDGTEVWALNALHGARIITKWVAGPDLAALPGRLRLWRGRLAALRHPLG
ncbi:MAG: aminotransferase class IV [Microbacteriaceae bacterium]